MYYFEITHVTSRTLTFNIFTLFFLIQLKWEDIERPATSGSISQAIRSSVTPSFATSFAQSSGQRDRDDKQNGGGLGGGVTCDVHSNAITVIHACKMFTSFSSAFYDHRLTSLAVCA